MNKEVDNLLLGTSAFFVSSFVCFWCHFNERRWVAHMLRNMKLHLKRRKIRSEHAKVLISTYMKMLLALNTISGTRTVIRCETLRICIGAFVNFNIREVCEKSLLWDPPQLFKSLFLVFGRKFEGIQWCLIVATHWFCCLICSSLVFERQLCKQMYRTILLICVVHNLLSVWIILSLDKWRAD